MITEAGAQEAANAAIARVRASAGTHPPAHPPASGSGSGGSTPSSGSGSSGSGGGSGGGSQGGNSSGDDRFNKARKFLAIAFPAVMLVAGILVIFAYAMDIYRSNDPAVMADRKTKRELSDKQRQREHEEKMAKARLDAQRFNARSGLQTTPGGASATQATTSGCVNPTDIVTHWSMPMKIKQGQCVKVSSGTQREFWITLSNQPTKISGKASFAEAVRPLTLEEKLARKKICLAGGSSAEVCEMEAQKALGVWKDDCVTSSTPDACLGYLQGKSVGTPIHVYAYDVEINTN